MTIDTSTALWIKDPLAILADGAERGILVQDGRIVELVGAGREPRAPAVKNFDAGTHVVLRGLINTHHHFYQTLTRAVPAALDRDLFPWLQALYPLWARLTPEAVDLASTLAMAELMLSGCTLTTDHHYVFPKGVPRYCLEIHQCRPLDYLEECGWLNGRTWLAHGVHFNADEFPRLARAGTAVTHCACSNQVLASGTCPVCAMEEAGVAVGLGVDGSASNNSSNLMQEVRAAFLVQRNRYGVGKVSYRDALRWATKGSAACTGRTDVGEIAVGMLADLALFKLDELRFSGSGDPLAALVLCGAHRADRVMVGGRWIVENGQIPGLDLADLIRRHSAAARKLQG